MAENFNHSGYPWIFTTSVSRSKWYWLSKLCLQKSINRDCCNDCKKGEYQGVNHLPPKVNHHHCVQLPSPTKLMTSNSSRTQKRNEINDEATALQFTFELLTLFVHISSDKRNSQKFLDRKVACYFHFDMARFGWKQQIASENWVRHYNSRFKSFKMSPTWCVCSIISKFLKKSAFGGDVLYGCPQTTRPSSHFCAAQTLVG